MYIIKWSNGDTYLQSFKKDKHVYIKEHQHAEQQHMHAEEQHQHAEQQHMHAEEQQHAEQQHMHAEQQQHGISRNYVFKDSYKEEVADRVGKREHIQQCCINPFLSTNFVKDLAVQEEYLKPKNSNYSK